MFGIYGEPSGRVGKVDARIEVLDFRLDSIVRPVSRNAINDIFVPDVILPKTTCCGYDGSNGFPNGRAGFL